MGNLEHQENLTLEPKTDSRFHTIRSWTLRTTVLLGALLNDADRANAQPPQIPAPPPAAEICDDECQPTEAGKKRSVFLCRIQLCLCHTVQKKYGIIQFLSTYLGKIGTHPSKRI